MQVQVQCKKYKPVANTRGADKDCLFDVALITLVSNPPPILSMVYFRDFFVVYHSPRKLSIYYSN